jgi:hypothetical protein
MPLPFDLAKFSSEIVTAVVTAAVIQVPKLWRALRERVRPDPRLPQLRITIRNASVRVETKMSGEVQLYVEFLNLSRWDTHLEQFQLANWYFDSASMPQADLKAAPPRLMVPRKGVGNATLSLRLHEADVTTISSAAVSASNIYSSPGHRVRLLLVCVLRRRFAEITLGPRELECQPEVFIPSGVMTR